MINFLTYSQLLEELILGKIRVLLSVFIVIFTVQNLYAITTQEAVQQRQNFEKQKEQFQKLEKNRNQKIFFYDTKKPVLEKKGSEQCIEIKKIKEDTITLLSKSKKEEIFKKYENGCRTLSELNNLTKELTKLYIDKGYVTSQVYFKAQKLDTGVLKLIAIEGRVGTISPDKLYLENAFLAQKGSNLNLRDLERAIESINRLPSNHATMKLVPAKKTGYTDIQVENKTTNRLNGSVGIDNYGSKKTGKLQGNLYLNLDNPLGINDQFSIYLNTTQNHVSNELLKSSVRNVN